MPIAESARLRYTRSVAMNRTLVLCSAVLLVSFNACKRNPPPTPSTPSGGTVTAGANGRVNVSVGAEGYSPDTIRTQTGRPLTVVFTRTSDEGCGQQVVFPSLNLRRDLPLNQPVEVTVTPSAGTLAFTCGMNMLHGSIVAQ